ncbi:MAG TPA: GNAT family N-acetyltransferase [Noviherbaspirillum sp.]|jgi:predicted GNAT family N-acyltransferase|uniref:GNAT family N-acetyltransferase n=1 Tax=Noviherbaspirillum sp. TaxID=1926288 RepID=UPI002F93A592
MNTTIRLGGWDELKAGAQAVRHAVFVVEQQVPVELEWDEMDAACLHALACDDSGAPVATGRLLPDGHIGRMAVLPHARGSGIGGAILAALMERARLRGDREVLLNAQTSAVPFYVRFGFVSEGEEFMEAGIPHIGMRHVFAT